MGADLKHASAYGDSHHDLFLLRAVREAVAVSPNARLLDAALANDWEVIAAGDKRRALPH